MRPFVHPPSQLSPLEHVPFPSRADWFANTPHSLSCTPSLPCPLNFIPHRLLCCSWGDDANQLG